MGCPESLAGLPGHVEIPAAGDREVAPIGPAVDPAEGTGVVARPADAAGRGKGPYPPMHLPALARTLRGSLTDPQQQYSHPHPCSHAQARLLFKAPAGGGIKT